MPISSRANTRVGTAVVLVLLACLAGCELLVSPDRTLIDAGTSTAGDDAPDEAMPPLADASPDAGSPDASLEILDASAAVDAAFDAGPDVHSDSAADSAADAPIDAPLDSPADAPGASE
jgi:hypothetical protein